MASDDVILIGATNLQQRSRQNANGTVKQRYTVEVSGTTFGFNTDPKGLGKGPAEAIAEHLRQRITGIAAVAATATLKAREVAQRAFRHQQEQKAARTAKKAQKAKNATAAKKAQSPRPPKLNHPKLPPKFGPRREEDDLNDWTRKRYSGGKIGPMEPNQSNRLFNDSGRLAASLVAGPNADSWIINVAANRFDPTTFNGGEAALGKMFARLASLVPEFADLKLLADSLPVRRAIIDATKAMVQRAEGRSSDLKWQLFARGVGFVRQLGRLAG